MKPAAIDGTGFEAHHTSLYFVGEASQPTPHASARPGACSAGAVNRRKPGPPRHARLESACSVIWNSVLWICVPAFGRCDRSVAQSMQRLATAPEPAAMRVPCLRRYCFRESTEKRKRVPGGPARLGKGHSVIVDAATLVPRRYRRNSGHARRSSRGRRNSAHRVRTVRPTRDVPRRGRVRSPRPNRLPPERRPD